MAVKKADRAGILAPLSFRVPPELRAKLENAASANGRSLTSEVLSRLEQSFFLAELKKQADEPKSGFIDVLPTENLEDVIFHAFLRALRAARDERDPDLTAEDNPKP